MKISKQDKQIEALRTLCCNAEYVRKGRADYECSHCKTDVSMEFVFLMDAIMNGNKMKAPSVAELKEEIKKFS